MPKKSRRNKPNPFYLKAVKLIVLSLVVIFLAFVGIKTGIKSLMHTKQFNIRKVTLDPNISFIQSNDLTRLRGKNIFEVNLRILQKKLSSEYPQVSNLKVIRRFPDEIYVFAIKRNIFATARVRNQKVIIDELGVVLGFGDAEKDNEIPYIIGLKQKKFAVRLGIPIPGDHIQVALDILKTYRRNEAFLSYPVNRIDVGNLSKISLYLESGFKIILDRDKISSKIKKFEILLTKDIVKPSEINYIDLRFKEPVIRKK